MGSRGGRGARRVAGVAVMAAVAGCSVVLGLDTDRHLATQASTDAGVDASTRPGPWDCVSGPNEFLDPGLNVDLTLLVMDALQPSTAAGAVDGGSDLDTISGTFLPGVSVRACELRDQDCTMGSSPVVTTDGGAAELHLTGDFVGFFQMSRPDLVLAALYTGQLLAGDKVVSYPAYDIRPDDFMALAGAVVTSGVSLDPNGTVGHTVVTVYDCQDHQAAGVTVKYSAMGPDMTAYYFQSGFPTTTASTTDDYGLAGASNVPGGALTATATLAATGMMLGSVTYAIRPGAISFAWVRVRSH